MRGALGNDVVCLSDVLALFFHDVMILREAGSYRNRECIGIESAFDIGRSGDG